MNKKSKIVLTSCMSIAISASLIAGSTFALFTSESSTNIAVTAGKVNVVASVNEESLTTYSYDFDKGSGQYVSKPQEKGQFIYGTAEYDSAKNVLALNKIVPGDKVEFNILITNESTVDVQYRILVAPTEYGTEDAPYSIALYNALDFKGFSSATWTKWDKETMGTEQTISVSVELPYDIEDKMVNGNTEDSIQGRSCGLSLTVEAIQGNANTAIVYPNGITADSFAEDEVAITEDGTRIKNTSNDIKAAINAGGTLYFKEGATVELKETHIKVTNDLTIYANGADFGGKDIALNTYGAPENETTTINVYNAKNFTVWGNPSDDGNTWIVNLYDCENEGYGLLMFRGADTNADTIHFTAVNCKTTGYTDSIIHTTADGTLTIKDCTFIENCAPVNIAHKQSGTLTVLVENCVFNECGKVADKPENDYFAPARFVKNSPKGALNVTLKNNTFNETVGTNGDILLGDYRADKKNYKVTAEIITETFVMVKDDSQSAAYKFAGGTIVAFGN